MGDADWLREEGLWWGWDDNYPEFRERPATSERWKRRDASKRISPHDELIDHYARDLIEIKNKIRELKKQEKKIKENLLKQMPRFSWLEISDENGNYIIERLKPRLRFRFDRAKAFRFIAKRVNSDLAASVLEECSYPTKGRDTVYVRPFPPSSTGFNDEEDCGEPPGNDDHGIPNDREIKTPTSDDDEDFPF